MTESRSYSILHVTVWLLLAGSVALIFTLSQVRFFDHDEFEAMHTTWKMFMGQQIYVDFLQHHHPFLYYMLLPFYAVFGSDVPVLLAARAGMALQLTLTLAVTYFIALELYRDRLVAVTSALFLSGIALFLDKMLEIRPDVPMSLLALSGAYLALRATRTEQRWLYGLSGVCFGLAFMFLQKAVILLFAVGVVLLVRLFTRKLRFGDLAAFGGGVLAPVLPYALYLLATNQLENFIFYNVTFNTLYYRLRGWELGKLIRNVNTLYESNILILIPFFYAALFLPKLRREWESLFFVASVLGFTLLTGRHNPQYYILAFPFMSVLAARAFWRVLRPRPLLAGLLLFFILYGPLDRYARFLLFETGTNTDQLARIERVLTLTEPDDYVYDGNIIFNLFRKDVDFVWWMTGDPYKAIETLEELKDYDYNIYERIETYEPKVISDFGIPDMGHPVIAENYVQDEEFPDLYVRRPVPDSESTATNP